MNTLPTIEERHFIIGKVARTIFLDRLHKEHNSTIVIRCPEVQDVITLTTYLEDIFNRLSFLVPKHFDTSNITKEAYNSDINIITITVNDKDNYSIIKVKFNEVSIWHNRIPLLVSLLTINDLQLFYFDRVSNNHKFFLSTNTSVYSSLKNKLHTAFTPCEASYYSIESLNKYWSCDYKTYLKEYCDFIYQLAIVNYSKINTIKIPDILPTLDNLQEKINEGNIPNTIYLEYVNDGFNLSVYGSRGLVMAMSHSRELEKYKSYVS